MLSIRMPFGNKHVSMLKNWLPSLATFGGTAAVFGIYITEWKVITKYIPFYGSKYSEEE